MKANQFGNASAHPLTRALTAAARLIAVVAVAAVLSSCKRAEEAGTLTPVKIGYGMTSDTLAVHVAKQEGIFERHGIDATVMPVAGGSSLNAGLVAGSLQMIMSNPAALLNAVNGGLDLVVVAGGPRMDAASDPIALLMRSDVAYAAPADLRGKKIAVPSFDSGMYFVLQKWLRMKGVEAREIEFVESGMAQMGSLLRSKKVDAVIAAEPFLTQIVSDGFGRLTAQYYTEVVPEQPTLFWAATGEWARRNPAAVQALQASMHEAAQFIAAHPEQAAALEKSVFKTHRAKLPNTNTSVTAADLEIYYRIGKELGLYHRQIDVATLIVPGAG